MIGAYAFLAKVGGRMHRFWAQDGPGQSRCMCIVLFPLSHHWTWRRLQSGIDHQIPASSQSERPQRRSP
eukprot:6995265-Pyramimonas_sp.AAC.1